MFSIPNNLVCVGWVLFLVSIPFAFVFISMSHSPAMYVMLTGIILAVIGYLKEFRELDKKEN